MPTPGKAWQHLILSTRGSWLPGDPRGFRTRNHRIHSTGDYKAPPPDGEHLGLYRHNRNQSAQCVTIPQALHETAGKAMIAKAASLNHDLLVISVGASHAHVLIETPAGRVAAKRVAGQLKQASSHALRKQMPGHIWARDCDPIAITDRSHQVKAFRYIHNHINEGSWVWCFKDEHPHADL